LKLTNQKQEWPVVAMFINGWELNAQSFCSDPLTNMAATDNSCS
jgi:hypothetical protein